MGRDLLARGASKAAAELAPDREALARVNNSAPQNQFVAEGGRIAGPNETPILEAKIPGTDMGKGAKENGEVEGRSGREEYAETNGKVTAEVKTAKADVGEKAENGGVQNGDVDEEEWFDG